jgi:hypothetical protein
MQLGLGGVLVSNPCNPTGYLIEGLVACISLAFHKCIRMAKNKCMLHSMVQIIGKLMK